MLSNGYSYYPHHGPAGIARRWPRPDSARLWLAPAISLFFVFCAFSPLTPAPRGALPGRITMPLNRDGRHIARMPLSLKRKASAVFRRRRHNPMQRTGNWVSTYWALFMLFALFGLTWCSGNWRLPKPPFGTPVDLSRGGVVADFNIRVTRHRIYHFRMRFEYPEGDRAEKERVRKIVGGLHEPTLVPTPVKLMIFKKQAQNEQMVYRITVEDPDTYSASSNGFGKKLGYCDLSPGEYRFVLESLAQPQEYASIPTFFYVATHPRAQFNPFKPTNFDRSKSCPEKVIQ